MDIETVYREQFSAVYRYILSISRNEDLAEEITQETFFKALKKLDSFRGETSIRVWLCQIAKNLYLDELKKQKKLAELPEEYGDPAPSPEDSLVSHGDAAAVHKALHRLKEPYKEVFSLRVFGELPYPMIAELFGKTESWARVTYYRAREMIRKELEKS